MFEQFTNEKMIFQTFSSIIIHAETKDPSLYDAHQREKAESSEKKENYFLATEKIIVIK